MLLTHYDSFTHLPRCSVWRPRNNQITTSTFTEELLVSLKTPLYPDLLVMERAHTLSESNLEHSTRIASVICHVVINPLWKTDT